MRILPPQQHQTGKAIGPRHVQVQQDQIPVGTLVQKAFQFGDAGRLHQTYVLTKPHGERLLKCTAEKRVIIGNDNFVSSHWQTCNFYWRFSSA